MTRPSPPALDLVRLAAVTALGEWWPALTDQDPSLFPGDLYADVFSGLPRSAITACTG